MCKINIKAAGEEYLARLETLNYSPRAIESYRSIIYRFADHFPSDADIKKSDVEEWRSKQNVSPNSLKHYMTILNAFFKWYGEEKKYGNPFENVQKPLPEEVKYNLLTLDEIDELLTRRRTEGHKSKDAQKHAIVVLMLTSGLRSGELRSLRLNDVDLENNTITVRHGKGDKSREVPFPSVAQEALKEYLATVNIKGDDVLFGSNADEYGHKKEGEWHEFCGSSFRKMIIRYVESVTGHKGIHPHTLRHAAASLWDDMAIDTRTIQKAMGHASLATTERIYISILDKSKAAKRINAAFNV